MAPRLPEKDGVRPEVYAEMSLTMVTIGIETMMREHPRRDPLLVIIWSAGRQSGIRHPAALRGHVPLCVYQLPQIT